MATILIGIDINQQCIDLDFGIDLADDVIKQIECKYKKALEESGMDDDDFGPAMEIVDVQDEDGDWYQDYAIDNKFDFDLTDFPRYHNYNPSNH